MNNPVNNGRCAKCRGKTLPNGICPKCSDVAESVARLQAAHKRLRSEDILTRQNMRKSSWWLRRAIEKAKTQAEELPLSGQDAALPVGDR